jgi:DNA-binding CsgD family transcriptional regulator
MQRDLLQLRSDVARSMGQIYRSAGEDTPAHSRTTTTALGQLRATLRVLEKLRVGVLLLDGQGHVCHANRSAEALLAEGDGLSIVDESGDEDEHVVGGLRAATEEETVALRQLITEVGGDADSDVTDSDIADNAIAISRPSGRRPLEVLVSPIAREGDRATPAVVAFVFDPGADPDLDGPAPTWTLMRLYALTPAEARVALEVAQGRGLRQAAAALGVSPNTVRTHLHHVFQKTGTRRQAELARLLLRGPMQLRLD